MITRLTLSLRSTLNEDSTALPYGWPIDILKTTDEENQSQFPTTSTVSDAAVLSGNEGATDSV